MSGDDRIRQRAHEIWEREGKPEGRHAEHWAQARREIEAEGGAAAPGESPTPTAPDHGGSTPAETAAAGSVEGQRSSEGGAASAEPAASSGSPTPTAPDHGGTTPGESAAAAANPGGRGSKDSARKT